MNKTIVIFVAMVCLLGGVLILEGCNTKSTTTPLAVEATLISAPVRSEGQIIAEGEVEPNRSAVLSFGMTGVITEVLVKEGEFVKANQVIARLEGKERQEAAVSAAELELLSANQALQNLEENSEVTRAAVQLALAEAETEYDRAKDRNESKDLLKGNSEQIEAAYADYILALEAVKDDEKEYKKYQDRQENDYARAIAQAKLASSRKRRDDAWRKYDDLNSKPDQFDVADAGAQLEVAQATMDKARKDWEEVKERGIFLDDLNLIQARIKNAEAQLASAKKALSDLELSAPFDGVLIKNDLKVGETSTPGVSTVTMADISIWRVKTTDLTELNVVNVREGSRVVVTFDAIPDLELPGVVTRIKGQGENRQGDITYTVTVQLEQNDERLRWNMTSYVTFDQ